MFPQVGDERCARNYQLFAEGPESPERPDRAVPKHKPFPFGSRASEGLQPRSARVAHPDRLAVGRADTHHLSFELAFIAACPSNVMSVRSWCIGGWSSSWALAPEERAASRRVVPGTSGLRSPVPENLGEVGNGGPEGT